MKNRNPHTRNLRLWKSLFWTAAVTTIISYGFLLPPIVADRAPGRFYSRLFYRLSPLYRSYPQEDTDQDGLPDNHEREHGTDIRKADTDGDGLTDYDEIRKYKTDPCSADSDNDGIADDDWEERREYTRTLRVITDLRRPYSLADMNNFYQDTRCMLIDRHNSRGPLPGRRSGRTDRLLHTGVLFNQR